MRRKVEFKFDERSQWTIEELKERGLEPLILGGNGNKEPESPPSFYEPIEFNWTKHDHDIRQAAKDYSSHMSSFIPTDHEQTK